MVPVCAKQGVEKKISFEDFLSGMLSDYECAYACGLAARTLGVNLTAQTPLAEAKQRVEEAIAKTDSSKDYRVKNLYQLLTEYTPEDRKEPPEEIPILLQMGLDSEFLDRH